jgi:hypothetical protein
MPAAAQGDCPSVAATCWNNLSRDAYQQAVDTFMHAANAVPTHVTPLSVPTALCVQEDGTTIPSILVKYFGIGGVHESLNYGPTPTVGGQSYVFALSNWHGHSCVLIDEALCSWLNIQDTLNAQRWRSCECVQLHVIASHQEGSVTLRDPVDIMCAM